MTYTVLLTLEAQEDLERLFDFVLERELTREGGDLDLAAEALAAIKAGLQVLERFPFTCRKAADNPFLRELVIPFGATGYVALFEVVNSTNVVVGAVRHQREDDYH
ncbi:type II toxin-antitoxin system RelE/ParE family toxin [Piscinibacter sp.]|jgi:plasmid stabilization system protein ParE|uniref:type II toxin-antitoxin system RelE/ParE family toxin n=1 Tax=Piscinibacter sp. TaxID=1903157 RepID=UPI00355A3E61